MIDIHFGFVTSLYLTAGICPEVVVRGTNLWGPTLLHRAVGMLLTTENHRMIK